MAFNPSPAVTEARDIAGKHGDDIVIVLGIKLGDRIRCASYGRTRVQCSFARRLGNALYGRAYDLVTQQGEWGKDMIAGSFYHEDVVRKLVTEGLRVGKAPWCCCGLSEAEAARRLEYNHGITERETMAQTAARRKKKEVTHGGDKQKQGPKGKVPDQG